jgi:2-dehydropantoate 2-reductase
VHIAIIGAGALGAVYGLRLALVANQEVTFVVRAARATKNAPLAIQRIDGDGAHHEIQKPNYATEIPKDASVIIVTVHQDQLDDDLIALLKNSAAPIVMLSPMFEHDLNVLVNGLGRRIFPAMASVVSYDKQGTFRYWLPRSATTAIESESAPLAVGELVQAIAASGISARLDTRVLAQNVATTVSFMPIVMAMDIAGSIDALMSDKKLLVLAIDSVSESGKLAKVVGAPAAWADLLLHFVGPFTLKAGIGLARMRAPEAVHYVEEHFGRKLHAQNLRIGKEMVDLAENKGVRAEQLNALYIRLSQAP